MTQPPYCSSLFDHIFWGLIMAGFVVFFPVLALHSYSEFVEYQNPDDQIYKAHSGKTLEERLAPNAYNDPTGKKRKEYKAWLKNCFGGGVCNDPIPPYVPKRFHKKLMEESPYWTMLLTGKCPC